MNLAASKQSLRARQARLLRKALAGARRHTWPSHMDVKDFAAATPLTALAQSYIDSEGMARNAAFSSLSLVPYWRPVPSSGAFFLGSGDA